MRVWLKNSSNSVVKLVAYPTLSLLKPNITWRKKDDEGFKSFSFTGDLEFIGEDYNFIKAELWDHPNAIQNDVQLTFDDECCGGNPFTFSFSIQSESIKWCSDSCSITGTAIEKSAESDAIKCLRNTLIWVDFNDTGFSTNQPGVPFTSKRHPRMTYCNEVRPSWLQDLTIFLAILFESFTTSVFPIIALILWMVAAIVIVVNFLNNNLGTNIQFNGGRLLGDPDAQTFEAFIQAWQARKDAAFDVMVGCGRKHPSPLVRTYAENVCAKCGLRFQSSIFNNPASDYFNTVYHSAPVSRGTDPTDTSTFWIDENKPLVDGAKFFDQLKATFNADWQVKNGVLTFERRDGALFPWTNQPAPLQPWLDLTQLDSDTYNVCYSWSKKTKPSYANFFYLKDAVNTVGAEAKWRFGDVVSWVPPNGPLPGQKGDFTPFIPFASCRFRDDHVRINNVPERDVLSSYENNSLVPPIIRNKIRNHKNCIILNQHLCYEPMLLIWDGVDVADARVSGTQFNPGATPNNPGGITPEASPGEFYNYPFWFDENLSGNMYDRFWSIDDPRQSGFKAKQFEAEIELTCLQVQNMDLDGAVKTDEGTGKSVDININYQTNRMIIKGEI